MIDDFCGNIIKISGDFLTLNYIKCIFERDFPFNYIKNLELSNDEYSCKLKKLDNWGVFEDISKSDIFVELDFDSKQLHVHFDTEKSCPLQISQELSRLYKNINIEHTFYSNCGFYVCYFICSGSVIGFIEDFF